MHLPCTTICRSVAALAVVSGLLFNALPAAAHAQTETVLYTFCSQSACTDGYYPYGALVLDKTGNLYSTTTAGGAHGYGAVFKLSASGTETVLYSFNPGNGTDGYDSLAGLVMDKKGNLYGTTYYGGASAVGTVFEVSPNGTETVLHTFSGSDGAYPTAGLVMDKKGNLYGTASAGGVGYGVVFEFSASGTFTILHSFNYSDGAYPHGGLVMDIKGNLYGTTYGGGANGYGTVFKVSAGTETVLYSFNPANGTDGAVPYAGLVLDKTGNLYGTTYSGGAHGYGTAFKFSAGGTETVLHSFAGGSDGYNPIGGLVLGKKGNLYGTTYGGGANGFGTVFKVSAVGTESLFYSFNPGNGTDGALPYAGLIVDKKGNLYGTTTVGGSKGGGVVFKLTP
jgi:uncharacterized repeat protein (TIGR03803 family)